MTIRVGRPDARPASLATVDTMPHPNISESRFYDRNAAGTHFTSPVFLDGWSRRSIWGLEDGHYFLTLWRDDDPDDTDPSLWHSVAHQPPLLNPGAVAITLMGHTHTDAVAASAALQILAPAPANDPRPTIAATALRKADETHRRGTSTRAPSTSASS